MTRIESPSDPITSPFRLNPHASEFLPSFIPPSTLPTTTNRKSKKKNKTKIKSANESLEKGNSYENVVKFTIQVSKSSRMIDPAHIIAHLQQQYGPIQASDVQTVVNRRHRIQSGWIAFVKEQSLEKISGVSDLNDQLIYLAPCLSGKGNTGVNGAATNSMLVLKNLPFDYDVRELEALLDNNGLLNSNVEITDHKDSNGKFKGIVFVDFRQNQQLAEVALPVLQNSTIGGRNVKVEYKKKSPVSKKSRRMSNGKEIREKLQRFVKAMVDDENPEPLRFPDTDNVWHLLQEFGLSGHSGVDAMSQPEVIITPETASPSNKVKSMELRRAKGFSELMKPRRERGSGSNVSLQNDRYAKGPDGSRGFGLNRRGFPTN